MKERSAPTFDGFSSSRRRRRRLCGGRMSGASLARRRIDKYDRRPHSTTKFRSSARSVAPALPLRRSEIEVPSSATLIVDGAAGRRQVPAEFGRDRRVSRRVAQERPLRRRASRAELVDTSRLRQGGPAAPVPRSPETTRNRMFKHFLISTQLISSGLQRPPENRMFKHFPHLISFRAVTS